MGRREIKGKRGQAEHTSKTPRTEMGVSTESGLQALGQEPETKSARRLCVAFKCRQSSQFWDFNLLLRCAFGVVEILHVVAKPALLPLRFRAPGKM